MQEKIANRRGFLAGVAVSGVALPSLAASPKPNETFEYEIVRTEEEWRAQLSESDYSILREGGTEAPHSSPLEKESRTGNYHCKGCGLHTYTSEWKVPLGKGWVFFGHSVPNSVLMDVDLEANYTMSPDSLITAIEGHCRRCGSHLGHILTVDRVLVHCINGAALTFSSTEA